MRSLIAVALCAILFILSAFILASCKEERTSAESCCSVSTEAPSVTEACSAQQILDSIYDNVELKDGRIYLSFGSRSTLTVENFNKLILQDQLGLNDGRFTFVIDPVILNALKHNNAYGGIGFGQEWIASVNVRIKDNHTGEVSAPADLIITFLKSIEVDSALNDRYAVPVTAEPGE